MNTYREMYRKSTPKADFDKLIKLGITKKRNWFMKYYLDMDTQLKIINKYIKRCKSLTRNERETISIRVHLGCSPDSYKESEKEKEKVLVETVSDDDIDTDSFLLQIQQEIELSRNFVNPKRVYLRSNVSKYVDQTIDDEKIPMNTAYAMINLSLAVELMDRTEPIFTPR